MRQEGMELHKRHGTTQNSVPLCSYSWYSVYSHHATIFCKAVTILYCSLVLSLSSVA